MCPYVQASARTQTLPATPQRQTKERTEKEYGDLLDAACFDLTSVSEPLPPFDYRVIEASSVPAR